MLTALRIILLVVIVSGSARAQDPAPPPESAPAAAQAPTPPELPTELQLARENLLLTARVNELAVEVAQLRAQLVNLQIGQRAPALIERLQAAAPGWDVDPQTLELTPRPAAVDPAAPPPTPPP